MHFLDFINKNSCAVIGGLFKEDKRENLLRLLLNAYSRASLYTASFSTDFAETRFSISSKNSMYTDFIV